MEFKKKKKASWNSCLYQSLVPNRCPRLPEVLSHKHSWGIFCVSIFSYQIKVVMDLETESLFRISRILKADDLWVRIKFFECRATIKSLSVMWEWLCLVKMHIWEPIFSWKQRVLMLTSTFNIRNKFRIFAEKRHLSSWIPSKARAWLVSRPGVMGRTTGHHVIQAEFIWKTEAVLWCLKGKKCNTGN